jgi:hypothetical protein
MHPTLIAGGLLLAGIGLAYAVASRRAVGNGQRKLDTNTPLQTAVVRETFEAKLDHDFSGTQERSL